MSPPSEHEPGAAPDSTEREVERLRLVAAAVVEATTDFVGVAGPDGQLLYLNPAGRRMVGIPETADLAEYSRATLSPAWVYERTQREWLPAALRDGSAAGEGALLTLAGEEIPVSFVMLVHRTPGGELEYLSTVARDVTARKRDVEALRQREEELAEAHRRKDEFLATLAHELRNPLAPLRNGLELLRLGAADPAVAERARAMMERQLSHMVRLIDDLLDVSRITRGKLKLRRERVDVATVVQSAVEASRPSIEAARHDLTVTVPSDPIHLRADPTRLAQVLTNLLTNAAKYTDPGGRIHLSVERRADEVSLSVRDTGIGIPADHIPKLFEMFSQVSPALERSQGGLGIGLSLVRGLVELHGGRVAVTSDGPDKGSEFTIRLPVAKGRDRASSPPDPDRGESPSPPKHRILVVDDNDDAAESLSMMLALLGHQVEVAHDGEEAIQAAASFQPGVVLLDIGLPRMNGYEVARHIRGQAWGKAMVLVALTGWGQEEDKRQAMEAGFDVHLTKPVRPADIEKLLQELASSPQR